MIDVVLDSETLRRHPHRASGPFRTLTLLACAGSIRLHLPDVARREFLTGRRAQIEEHLDKVARDLNQLRRHASEQTSGEAIDRMESELKRVREVELAAVEASLAAWIERTRCSVLPIAPPHAADVFDRYFMGGVPFKSVKRREDIPDAFVLAAAEDLLEDGKQVVLVTGDEAFLEAIERQGRFVALPSVEALLEIPDLEEAARAGVLANDVPPVAEAALEQVVADGAVLDDVAAQVIGRRVIVFYPLEGVYEVARAERVWNLIFENGFSYLGNGYLQFEFSAIADLDLVYTATKRQLERLSPSARAKLSRVAELPDGAVQIAVKRSEVVAGSVLAVVDPSMFGKAVPKDTGVDYEAVTDLEAISSGSGDDALTTDAVSRQALMIATEEIAAGNLDTSLDPDEERDRLARAKWCSLPEEMQGTRGGFKIGPDTQLKVAPKPRFENWVKIFKKHLLEPRQGENTEER